MAAIWTNLLWIPKRDVPAHPERFAPEWTHQVPLLLTAEGREEQNAIGMLREQAKLDDLDPDTVAKFLDRSATMAVRNWTETKDWWALCAGDEAKVRALLARLKLEVIDRRVSVPWAPELAERLRMEMTPRSHQVEPFKAWMRAGYGLFHAAPAFGKTFIFIWSILQRRQRTLVLVDRDTLAGQLINRFREGAPNASGDGSSIRVTNCLDVERELHCEVIGRYKHPNKLYPVTVATWQSFSGPHGRRALKLLCKSFGYVICDEAHMFASPAPAAVVNGFHARTKAGVTGTPFRKDGMQCALFDVLGPVTAFGSATQVPVRAWFVATGCTYNVPRVGLSDWTRLLNWLAKQGERNALIAEWLVTDVAAGRTVLVLAERVKWCFTMADMLRRKYGIEARAVVGGLTSERQKAGRQQTFQDVMDGRVKVLFATPTVKAGLDLPILDTLYLTAPMNNLLGLEQALGRGRRPYASKLELYVRYFADSGSDLLVGCATATQRMLVAGGHEILLVPIGREPDRVMNGVPGAFTAPEAPKTVRKGLARAVSRRPEVMAALLDEVR